MSGASKSKKHFPKGKKFVTRGEEFFDFLKELGYQPSKHLQPEHFEYLFQDEETNGVVQKLMGTLKPANCLSLDEINRFEALKSQDVVLYGADLEEAVKRHQSVLELYSRHHDKQKLQSLHLQRELTTLNAELQHLQTLEDNLTKVSEKQSDDLQHSKVLNVVESLLQENDHKSHIKRRLLEENMRRLETTTLQLLRLQKESGIDLPNSKSHGRYICQINGSRILSREENIFQKIYDILRNYGPALMLKEAGFHNDGDPLIAENVKKIFLQFKNNFDRVKHCIVYEKKVAILFKLYLAEVHACNQSFEDCSVKATICPSFSNNDNLRPWFRRREVMEYVSEKFGYQQDNHTEETIQRLQDVIVLAVARQFSTLTDIKTHTKRNLEKFFTVITNVLKAQKIRLTLIRNLSKCESKLYGRIINSFEETIFLNSKSKKRLSSLRPGSNIDLTFEGHMLSFLLENFGWPKTQSSEILKVPQRAYQTASRICDEIDTLTWRKVEEKQVSFENDYKQVTKMLDFVKQSQLQYCNRAGEGCAAGILALNNQVKSQTERLRKFKQTSGAILREKRMTRAMNLERMRSLLR